LRRDIDLEGDGLCFWQVQHAYLLLDLLLQRCLLRPNVRGGALALVGKYIIVNILYPFVYQPPILILLITIIFLWNMSCLHLRADFLNFGVTFRHALSCISFLQIIFGGGDFLLGIKDLDLFSWWGRMGDGCIESIALITDCFADIVCISHLIII
jgi:hypothetical protein